MAIHDHQGSAPCSFLFHRASIGFCGSPGLICPRVIFNLFPNLPCTAKKLAPTAGISLVPEIIGSKLHLASGKHWPEFRRQEEGWSVSALGWPLEQLYLSGVLFLAGEVHGFTVCVGWFCALDSRNIASFLVFQACPGSGYLLLLISKSSHHSVWLLSSSRTYATNSQIWILWVLTKSDFVFLKDATSILQVTSLPELGACTLPIMSSSRTKEEGSKRRMERSYLLAKSTLLSNLLENHI